MIDWISVKERLPDNDREILIRSCYGYSVGHISCCVGGGFLKDSGVQLEQVTHWAEINEPQSQDMLNYLSLLNDRN